MKRLSVLCIALLSLVVLPVSASAIGFEVAAGAWNQSPGGHLAYDGNSLDVTDALGLGNQTRFMGRAKIDMPLIIPNVYVMATPMNFQSSNSIPGGFTFGGKSYDPGTFDSEINLDHYDFALYYGLPFLGLATLETLNIDAGLNLRFINFDAKIDQATTNLHESKSFTLTVPMVYVGAQFTPMDRLSIEGEIRGIAYSANHFYDIIGRVKYKVIKVPLLIDTFVAVGYRYENIKIDAKDVMLDMSFSGPFAEIGIEF